MRLIQISPFFWGGGVSNTSSKKEIREQNLNTWTARESPVRYRSVPCRTVYFYNDIHPPVVVVWSSLAGVNSLRLIFFPRARRRMPPPSVN